MNVKNLLFLGVFSLLAVPVLAQDSAVQTTNPNGSVVTTVTKTKRQTMILPNAPQEGDGQERATRRHHRWQEANSSTDDSGQKITVTINDEPVVFEQTSRPIMLGGRVMVPLRGVTEKLGGTVLYDDATRVITGAHPATGNQFRLRVGSEDALLNGKEMSLDTPPQVINGTTYVPLRFVSEALGAKVHWESQQHSVIIRVAETRRPSRLP